MPARIKKNDTVCVMSGKDKGKKGSVISLLPKKGKIMVQGVALLTHHKKARRAGETGGIVAEESYIDISRVMPMCSSCKGPVRTNSTVLDTGERCRACNRCGKIF